MVTMNADPTNPGSSTPAAIDTKGAWKALKELPRAHRLPAFIVVFVSIVLCTFIGSLIAKDGVEYLTSTPIIGFGVFALVALAVLFSIPRSRFAGVMVGQFYLLPILYAAIVLTLAILDRAGVAGPLTLLAPADGGSVRGTTEVNWEPGEPALVEITRDGRTVASSQRFVRPPFPVELASAENYSLRVRSRTGNSVEAAFSVLPDPRSSALNSLYRPPAEELEGKSFLEGDLTIPRDFAIDATLDIRGYGPVKVFGRADPTTAQAYGLRRPGGQDLCSYHILQITLPPNEGVTIRLHGYVIDRFGQQHDFDKELTATFRDILVSVSIGVQHDGSVSFHVVPG